MTKDIQIEERRDRVKRMLFLEFKSLPAISRELGVSLRTAEGDAAAIRQQVIRERVKLPTEVVIAEFMEQHDFATKGLRDDIRTTDSEGDIRNKIKAEEAYIKAIVMRIDKLQSLNVLEKASEKQDIVIRCLRPGEDKKADKK